MYWEMCLCDQWPPVVCVSCKHRKVYVFDSNEFCKLEIIFLHLTNPILELKLKGMNFLFVPTTESNFASAKGCMFAKFCRSLVVHTI